MNLHERNVNTKETYLKYSLAIAKEVTRKLPGSTTSPTIVRTYEAYRNKGAFAPLLLDPS